MKKIGGGGDYGGGQALGTRDDMRSTSTDAAPGLEPMGSDGETN